MMHSHASPQKAVASILSVGRSLKKSRTGTGICPGRTARFVIVDAMLDKDEVARFVAEAIRQIVTNGQKHKKK